MNKKTILIGLGVLAVAGIGYYMWKKKSETTSGACGCSGADGEEESNATAGTKAGNRCPSGYHYDNGHCKKNASAFTADTYVAGWENEPKSDYTAGWDKNGDPRPCAYGYNASLDSIKGTICTHTFVKKRGALTA